jgi:hypothetical protein
MDDEDRTYFLKLRKSLVECFTSIVSGLGDSNSPELFMNHYEPVIKFLMEYYTP